jgi:splicing factor 3A subunit 3
MASMGDGENVDEALRLFYDRVKRLRKSRADDARAVATDPGETLERLVDELVVEHAVTFSGEESHGRYLDLHESYARFVDGGFGTARGYGEYLSACDDFASTPRAKKFSAAYRTYLDGLFDYLRSFHERAVPLRFVEEALRDEEEAFESRWRAGECPGWEDRGVRAVDETSACDLSAYATIEEMTSDMSGDDITRALESMGLKAGGAPAHRAERLWSVRGKKLADVDKKLFAKGVVVDAKTRTKQTSGGGDDDDAKAKAERRARAVAYKENRCALLLRLLSKQLDATRTNVEKKSTLSLAELRAEAEEDDDFSDADTDEEEEIHNPLKLPLGWDGKPIPYWLYKLHGLNMEYTCEICGNYSYWGRRAFERHFSEWRHQHGMRCLKIPYSKAFNEVTSIDDARALHKNLSQRDAGVFDVTVDAEVEDAQGNVYNTKTYEDLRRQGLL